MDGKDRENAGNRYKKKTVKLLLITVLVLAALAGAAFRINKDNLGIRPKGSGAAADRSRG